MPSVFADMRRVEGAALKEMRERLGWTQRHAARVMGATRSAWAHWEQGRANIPDRVAVGMRARAAVWEQLDLALSAVEDAE